MLTLTIRQPVPPADYWTGQFSDGPIPMGRWNLSAEQAADDTLLRKNAADAYPAYSEIQIVRE